MRARLCSALCARPDRRQFRSGVRNKAEYRSLTEFTDNDLRSDFHFLSDVERVADTAHREAYKAKLMLRPELPNHLRNLVRQAAFRSVALQIMPATLQRRKQNTTFFNHKSKEMHWRVEFVFHMDGAAVHAHDKVPDATPLRELLGKHLDPDLGIKNAKRRHLLPATAKAGLDALSLLIRVEPSLANASRYYLVSPDASVADAVRNKVVIEYPTIHIMSQEQVREIIVLPTPDAVPNVAPDAIAAATGAKEQMAEALPYARKRRQPAEFDVGMRGGHGRGGRGGRGVRGGRGRGRGHRGGYIHHHADALGGREIDGESVDLQDYEAEEEGPSIPRHPGIEELEEMQFGAETEGGRDSGDEAGDLADPELLSRIAGAESAEELRKVHAEIEAALGLERVGGEVQGLVTPPTTQEGDVGAAVSGLTPNVADLHVAQGGHL